jgi:hypothetical protein
MHVREQLHAAGIVGHVHYPYFYVSTSRYCNAPNSYDGAPIPLGSRCRRECLTKTAVQKQAQMRSNIYRKGNASFMSAEMPETLFLENIDRIIYNKTI